MGKKIEGYWDCPWCGTKANKGRYRNCPNCGRPRGDSTKFYLIEKDKFVSDSVVPKGPDWLCECCDSYNTYSAQFCTSCGAPKGASKDYFDIRKELKRPERSNYGNNSESKKDSYQKKFDKESSGSDSSFSEESKDDSHYSTNYEAKKSNDTKKTTYSNSKVELIDSEKISFFSSLFSAIRDNASKILIALAVIIAIVGIVYVFLPKEVDLTVDRLTWKREIRVEEYKTVRESDWYIPSGGRLVYTREEVKDHKPIYERQAVQKSERYISGYETETEYVDLGNGYFDTVTHQEPIYSTRYYTEYEDVLVGYEPIYATKYYYDIERWLYSRSVISNGEKKNQNNVEKASSDEVDSSVPYWPNVFLKSKEREAGRYEQYYVLAYRTNDKKREVKQYSISRSLWDTVVIGSKIKAVVQLGNVKEILE